MYFWNKEISMPLTISITGISKFSRIPRSFLGMGDNNMPLKFLILVLATSAYWISRTIIGN